MTKFYRSLLAAWPSNKRRQPGRIAQRVTSSQLNRRRRAMHSKEVLHRFIQQGHDPAGRTKGIEARGDPGRDVRNYVDLRKLDKYKARRLGAE